MKSLATPATLTTIGGAVLAIAIAVVDVWVFHGFPKELDTGLLGAGLGALLGVNPVGSTAP